MALMMVSVKLIIISNVHPTDARTVDDGGAEKPIWDEDINIDDIDPPTTAKSKAELKEQNKKEKKKTKKVDEDVGVDVDEMDADLDAGAGWDGDGEEWRGTEEERKRKVDAYMDEVVNKLGFSGIVSPLSLQTWIVFTRKSCRRPTCLRVFITPLWLLKITALHPRKFSLRRTRS